MTLSQYKRRSRNSHFNRALRLEGLEQRLLLANDLGDHPIRPSRGIACFDCHANGQTIGGRLATADGPINTFPLRGIKDSPPHLHDGRLLTLDDTVEFFNLILELKLIAAEKTDLVAFLRAI